MREASKEGSLQYAVERKSRPYSVPYHLHTTTIPKTYTRRGEMIEIVLDHDHAETGYLTAGIPGDWP